MLKINFHNTHEIDSSLLKFAVIAAKHNKKWIYCRHNERNTYEIPGGHREIGENILDTAKRELYEETGSVEFNIFPVCVYSVTKDDIPTYGMLFFAEIKLLEMLPKDTEIAEIIFADDLPEKLTYPQIQPYLFEKVKTFLDGKAEFCV